MSEVIFVPSIFSAIKQLEAMEFARSSFDKEIGHVEWRNKQGDRAEIIFNKHLQHWTIGIDIDLYKTKQNGAHRMGKNDNDDGGKTEPTPQEIARQENTDKAFEQLKELVKENEANNTDPNNDAAVGDPYNH